MFNYISRFNLIYNIFIISRYLLEISSVNFHYKLEKCKRVKAQKSSRDIAQTNSIRKLLATFEDVMTRKCQ